MRKVGVLISDAKLQFELMEALRAEGIPFEMVGVDDLSLREYGVLMTTEHDRPEETPCKIILCSIERLSQAVKEAKAELLSKGRIQSLIIGIDPGNRPGIAFLADQAVLDTAIVDSPEAVADKVSELMNFYPCDEILVRLGSGDRTRRNRIFNSLWDLELTIEIVDESHTSQKSDRKDIDAAIEIARTPGYRPVKKQLIEPPDGEISDIQRKSRIQSDGELTISRELATSVARGEITLEEAIDLQRASKKNDRSCDQASNKT